MAFKYTLKKNQTRKKVITNNLPHSRNASAEKVRPLIQARSHQKAAIGTASYGQLVLTGVLVIDKELSGSNEVIKTILFVIESSGIMPFFAVFSSSSDIGNGIITIMLYKKQLAVGEPVMHTT